MRSCMGLPSGPIEIGQNASKRDQLFAVVDGVASELIQAHIKYRLIDEITGYRNNWLRLSQNN